MKNLEKTRRKVLTLALVFFAVMAISLLISPMSVEASEKVSVGDYTYTITDGTAVLSKYNGTSSSVTIPTSMTYGGVTYKIRKIEANAFEGNTYIKTLVIPEGITSVGNAAFKNCTSLTSITINGDIGDCNSYSTQYDGYPVFYNAGANATSLTVTFGSSVTSVPEYLFATPSSKSDGKYAHVTSVKFSDSITEIGYCAFSRCYDLKTITWGSGLTTIEGYAFYNNTSLTTVSLPSKLVRINANAFESCTGITHLVLPESLTSVGNAAFKNCTSLKSITINGDIGDCHSYSTQYDGYPIFYNAGANSDSLSVTFGSSVTRIPAYLFAAPSSASNGYYAHITSVSISTSVAEIGECAFYHCYDLATVTMNCDGLSIGSNSFAGVTAIVYYASPNATWTSELRANYGGSLTWTAKFMSGSKMAFSSVTSTSSGIKLSWSKVSSATGYKIYRKVGSGSYSLLKTITSNSTVTYTDTSASYGTAYTYYIQAYNSSVTSSYTAQSIAYFQACSVSYVCNTMDGLKAAWNKVTGATGYYIYRRNDDGTYSSTPTATVTSGSTTNWTDTSTLTGGKDYTYKVAAYYKDSSGTVIVGTSGTTKTCKYLKGGEVTGVANTESGVYVAWKQVSGANGYYVYRKASGGDYSLVKTITDGSTLYWFDTSSLSSGKNYTYKVAPFFKNSSGQITKGGAKTTKTVKYLTTGKISSLSNTSSGIYIKWTKVSGASGYYIYRKNKNYGSYSLVTTIKSVGTVSYTDTSVKSNNSTTYIYYVQPYFESSSGAITTAGYSTKRIIRLIAPGITSLANTSSKKMLVKWERKSGVTGYQIQYSASSTFASGNKTITIEGLWITSQTISGLTKNKTYYVRVRSYETEDGVTYYSAWSSKKSLKITK